MARQILGPVFSAYWSVILLLAVGATYAPFAVRCDGKIYTENDGDVFVEGR
jgi:hypothetical protein